MSPERGDNTTVQDGSPPFDSRAAVCKTLRNAKGGATVNTRLMCMMCRMMSAVGA